MVLKIILSIYFSSTLITTIYCNKLYSYSKVSYIKQDSDSTDIFIERILVFGNDVTKKEVILREIQTKENSKTNLKILHKDVLRLYNL